VVVQIPTRSKSTTGGLFVSLDQFVAYFKNNLGPTDRASVRVIERKRVTWSRKELGSKAPVSFHTTDQKVRGSNPFGRTSGFN
jgi:hypothetical protein